MQKKRPPNLFDVARLAEVSIATVSRGISHPEKVRKTTLKRVDEAVEKLGYVVDGAGRALSSKRTYTVGAIIPTLDNSIFANTTNALQKVLDQNGYMLVVACNEFDLEVEPRLIKNLIERGVDGLVLVGTEHNPEVFSLISKFHMPYVLTWAFDPGGRLPCVGFDFRKATAGITEHLIGLGHQHFGVISGITKGNERVRQRLTGVVETLERHGISIPKSHVVEVPFSATRGREAMHALMSDSIRPTAVICLNDVQAIGAMAECHARGLSVPQDISITGCEDLEIASMVSPALTTVRFPTAELGHFAGTYLLHRFRDDSAPRQKVFPTELMIRDSTAIPNVGMKRRPPYA